MERPKILGGKMGYDQIIDLVYYERIHVRRVTSRYVV